MTNLSDEDRALLDLAQDLDAPTDRDRARVRAALASRLGLAAGLTAAAAGLGTATQAAAATATTGTAATGAGVGGVAAAGGVGTATVAAKLVGAAIVVSMTVGVGATVVRHQRHGRLAPTTVAVSDTGSLGHAVRARTQVDRTNQQPSATPSVPAVIPADQQEADPPSLGARPAPSDPAASDGRAQAKAASERPSAKEGTPAARTARPATSAVADEAALVHAGVVALRSGQAARALDLFNRHALLYPQGVLAEERDAERALALADLGRAPDARAAIEKFLSAHPASPLGARLRERQRLLDAAHP
jgi:hypothetical protein